MTRAYSTGATDAPGAIRTRRWNDPVEEGDGLRVLVVRYRPRGLRREDETWEVWWTALAPSVALHAAVWGKAGKAKIGWDVYRARFLVEMDTPAARFHLRALAGKVAAGETVTLLCSSACTDPARCHREILAGLVEKLLAPRGGV